MHTHTKVWHVCMYVYIHIYLHAYTYTHKCIHVCIYISHLTGASDMNTSIGQTTHAQAGGGQQKLKGMFSSVLTKTMNSGALLGKKLLDSLPDD